MRLVTRRPKLITVNPRQEPTAAAQSKYTQKLEKASRKLEGDDEKQMIVVCRGNSLDWLLVLSKEIGRVTGLSGRYSWIWLFDHFFLIEDSHDVGASLYV